MTLNHHVYAIKKLLASGTVSDDFSFSSSLIAHFLQISRARLLEQKADKYHYISEQSYQDLCLDLELSDFHSCCDNVTTTDCKVLKSITVLPKFLNSRWGNFVKVLDRTGRVIPEFNLTQNRFSKYALSTPNEGWFMHNNYIYVVNSKVLTQIIVNALFDDPSTVQTLNCPVNQDQCVDPMLQEFPIDSDLIEPMYKLTLGFLLPSHQLPSDLENNAKDIEITNARQ